jgi:hypothetical protein
MRCSIPSCTETFLFKPPHKIFISGKVVNSSPVSDVYALGDTHIKSINASKKVQIARDRFFLFLPYLTGFWKKRMKWELICKHCLVMSNKFAEAPRVHKVRR